VDVLVYTVAEWERLTSRREGKRWWEEVIWLSLWRGGIDSETVQWTLPWNIPKCRSTAKDI